MKTPRGARLLGILAVTTALLSFAGSSEAATRTWDGGGGDTNWNTAANWSSNSIPGSGDVARFNNTSAKNCTINVSVNVAGINIVSNYTGTITQGAGNSVTVGTSDFVVAGGTFTGGNSAIDCADRFTQSGGAFTSTTGTLFVDGNFTISGGTFNHNSGTVTLDGGGATLNSGSATLNRLVIDKGTSNLTVTGTAIVAGNLTITTVGNINTGTLAVAGNVTTTDNAVAGSGTIRVNGTGAQTLGAGGGTGELPSVEINKASGTLTLQDTLEVSRDWTYTAGTVNAGAGTVRFQGSAANISSGAMAFNNAEIDLGGSNLTVTGTMDVNGNFTITTVAGINTGTITVAGNVTANDSNVSGSGKIKMDGTGAQILTAVSGGNFPNGEFIIDKASGTVTLGSHVVMVPPLTITNGTLSQGVSYDLEARGGISIAAGGILLNTGTGDLTLGDDLSNAGTVSVDSGGAGSSSDDILVRSTGTTKRTWSGAGTFTLTDLDVQRMQVGVTPGILQVVSGTDSGNNVNWLFPALAPVLHLKMDDGSGTTASDSSPNANHGTLLGGTTWSSDRAPLTVSNPYSNSFDGVDDSISVPDASPVNPSLAFTISAWIKPVAVASGSVLAKWSAVGNNRQYLLRLSAGKLVLEVSTDGKSDTVRGVTSGGSIAAGTWYHVAGRYAADEVKVYIDGVGTAAAFSLAGAYTSSPLLRVGRDEEGDYFNGLIDEVRLYNRALSDGEIAVLAERDTVAPAAPTGLVLTANSESTGITATVTAPADADVSELIWRYNSADGNTSPSYPSTHTSGAAFGSGTTSGVTPSSSQQMLSGTLAQLKSYAVAVWARDAAGNVSASAANATLYLGPPSPRLVVTAAASATSAEAGSELTLTITARDAGSSVITGYAGPYSLTWTPTGGTATTLVNSSSSGWVEGVTTASASIGGANAGPGSFQAADNSTNNLAAGTLSFTWYPASFAVSTSPLTVVAGKPFPLSVIAKDKNGLTVTRYAGKADLSLTYEDPASGTREFVKKAFLSAEFSAGAALANLVYPDAGQIKVHVKDTTYVSGKTIAGASEKISFIPALFRVKVSTPPPDMTHFYVNQPFDVTVEALAEDKATITPNYAGAITLTGTGTGTGGSTQTVPHTFLPAVDKGAHVFPGLKAPSPGAFVLRARGGPVEGVSDPVGIRAGVLVINPASGAPGTLQSTAFILDPDTKQVVSEDRSTRIRLILESPSAGAAATSPAAVGALAVDSGVAPFSIEKTDAGEVTVRAEVLGFPMPVIPAVFRWIAGTSQTGGRPLNAVQFEQAPAGRFQTPAFTGRQLKEPIRPAAPPEAERALILGPRRGVRPPAEQAAPVSPGLAPPAGPGAGSEGGVFRDPDFGGDFFGDFSAPGAGFSGEEGRRPPWYMGPGESYDGVVPDWDEEEK